MSKPCEYAQCILGRREHQAPWEQKVDWMYAQHRRGYVPPVVCRTAPRASYVEQVPPRREAPALERRACGHCPSPAALTEPGYRTSRHGLQASRDPASRIRDWVTDPLLTCNTNTTHLSDRCLHRLAIRCAPSILLCWRRLGFHYGNTETRGSCFALLRFSILACRHRRSWC